MDSVTSMKDHIATVIEAVRRAQAKIAFYSEPGHTDARRAFTELTAILEDRAVVRAMRLLSAPGSPSLVPDATKEDVSPAPPMSR
jgi:hypothetical protein